MSDTIANIVTELKNSEAYSIVNGNNRGMNLQSIELLSITGFDPETDHPQTCSIKSLVTLTNYSSDYKITANVIYSAAIPADWSADTTLDETSKFAREHDFDISVEDARLYRLETPVINLLGGWSTALHSVDLPAVEQVLLHKLLGNMPSDVGLDNYLVSEINSIIRNRLFEKFMMQVGSYPTSIEATNRILRGSNGAITSMIHGGLDYRFLTNTIENHPNDVAISHQQAAYLQVALRGLFVYDAGYEISVYMVYRTDYPNNMPPPQKNRDIRKFLDTANFDCKVIKADISRNHTNPDMISTENYLSIARVFDKDEACSQVQAALNDPSKLGDNAFGRAVHEMIDISKQSIGNRIKSGGLTRLDVI